MSTSKPKRSHTREVLEDNGIYFYEESEPRNVPRYVNSLRKALCDVHGSITQRLAIYKDDKGDLHDDEYLRFLVSSVPVGEQTLVVSALERLRKVKDAAEVLQRGQDREREWATFYNDNFFNRLARQMDITDEDSRRISRAKFYHDYFQYAQDRPWTLFDDDFRYEYNQTGLSQPKPDLAAYFPIYDFQDNSNRISNRTQRWNWATGPLTDIVDNFSRQTLQSLTVHGLRPSPAKIFNDASAKRIEPSDCMCYPWLIVEHKKLSQSVEVQCFCQAANAAAAELLMYRILVRHDEHGFMPPVVAMTTVGNSVRIWIAYFEASTEKYHMISIWKGDVTTLVDIVELESILENLHTWASRTLRPQISHYIDQWRHVTQLRQESIYVEDPIAVDEETENHETSLIEMYREETEADTNTDWIPEDRYIQNLDCLSDLFKSEIQILSDKLDSLHVPKQVSVVTIGTQTELESWTRDFTSPLAASSILKALADNESAVNPGGPHLPPASMDSHALAILSPPSRTIDGILNLKGRRIKVKLPGPEAYIKASIPNISNDTPTSKRPILDPFSNTAEATPESAGVISELEIYNTRSPPSDGPASGQMLPRDTPERVVFGLSHHPSGGKDVKAEDDELNSRYSKTSLSDGAINFYFDFEYPGWPRRFRKIKTARR